MSRRLPTLRRDARRMTATLLLAGALGACAMHTPHTSPACRSGEQAAVNDALYFGTGKPNGGIVTPDEWANFLEAAVTPRFPQGLTVSQASGQWRGEGGALVKEATHVLHLVHPDDAASERSVAEIVAAYKAQFQQEAVLRVKAGACISF